MQNSNQERLRVVIYDDDDAVRAEFAVSAQGIEQKVPENSDVSEIRKYVNVIEAALALGTGTYTGTIAQVPTEKGETAAG